MLKSIKRIEAVFTVTKAAAIIGLFTLLIKFTALYRERLFSGTFGQGTVLDSYYSAFRIPDFLTTVLVSGTLAVAFLPVFTSAQTEEEEQAAKFTNLIIAIGSAVIGVLCLVLFFFSRPLVNMLVPGFTGIQLENTLSLTRLFLLSPIIFTIGTLYGAVLNAKKLFLVSSFAPLLYNGGIIFGIIVLYPRFGIMGLGYGVILGGLAQLLIQVVAAYYTGYSLSFNFSARATYFREFKRLYIPRIFSFDLASVTLLAGTVIGSSLMAGSITGLNQAYNLQAVPVSVFGYSIALAAFPWLSQLFVRKNEKGYALALAKSVSQILFLIIPVSILFLLYRAHIVRLALGTGKFSWEDTIRTFQILGIFSFSFFSQSLTTLLSRAFFARHETKTPVFINIGAIIINLILSIALGRFYGVVGITAAFVAASIFNATMLFIFMRNRFARNSRLVNEGVLASFDRQIFSTLWKTGFASIAMGSACYYFLYFLAGYLNTRTVIGLLLQAGISGLIGVAVFFVVAHLLGLEHKPNISSLFGKKSRGEDKIIRESNSQSGGNN